MSRETLKEIYECMAEKYARERTEADILNGAPDTPYIRDLLTKLYYDSFIESTKRN